MNAFAKIQVDNSIQQEKDTLGSSFKVLDSGVYPATIKWAYQGESSKGSMFMAICLDINGQEHRETLYVTNAKGQTFYEKDGQRHPLPSYITAESIALLAGKKSLTDLDTETQTIKLYNFEQRQEVPTDVPMLTDLVGKTIQVGLLKEIAFKQVKDDMGNYVDSDETKESNVIDKVFHATNNKTVPEIRNKTEEAQFITEWSAKWTGEVRDKTKGKKPAVNNKVASKTTSSLFA